MLGRSVFPLVAYCLVFCACNGNYKKKACAADGGCAETTMCDGNTCDDAGASNDASDTAAQAGSAARTQTQATRVAKDAGAASAAELEDAATAIPDDSGQPDMPSAGAGGARAAGSAKSSKSGQAGAAGAAMMPEKKEQAGRAGAGDDESAGDQDGDGEEAACEQTCGPCQACGEDNTTCAPIAGRDDADSCSDTLSCSSRGECLHISEAQADLGDTQEYAELTQSYAQVLSFGEPTTIQEIRLEVSCNENDQTFPAVWLAAAPGGIPSDTILATANVLYQPPSDTNTFALLELSKALEEPATGPIAIVVSQTEMSCIIRLNTQTPYPNGVLFNQTTGLWTPTEGSMVFQVLSSQ